MNEYLNSHTLSFEKGKTVRWEPDHSLGRIVQAEYPTLAVKWPDLGYQTYFMDSVAVQERMTVVEAPSFSCDYKR